MLYQAMNGVDIANNIIDGNGLASPSVPAYGIKTSACTGSGVQIRNNLFYNNRDGAWLMTANGSTVSYTTSANITTSDPLFVNSASNWHLQKCSPAIDSGLTFSEVAYDYDGIPRPLGAAYLGGAYDMGAYER